MKLGRKFCLTFNSKIEDKKLLAVSFVTQLMYSTCRDTVPTSSTDIDKAFNFEHLVRNLGYHLGSYSKEANRSAKQKHMGWARLLVEKSRPLKDVGDKFSRQAKGIIARSSYLVALIDRVAKARRYFESELKSLIDDVEKHIEIVKDSKGVKAYLKELTEVRNEFHHLILEMSKVQMLLDAAQKKEDFTKEQLYASEAYKEQLVSVEIDKKRKKPFCVMNHKAIPMELIRKPVMIVFTGLYFMMSEETST